MGRKPIGQQAMSAAERQRRRRARLKPDQALLALRQAWEACPPAARRRFLRELGAVRLKAKQERRAERLRELNEKLERENARRGPQPVTRPDGSQITGWLNGLPIIYYPRPGPGDAA